MSDADIYLGLVLFILIPLIILHAGAFLSYFKPDESTITYKVPLTVEQLNSWYKSYPDNISLKSAVDLYSLNMSKTNHWVRLLKRNNQ